LESLFLYVGGILDDFIMIHRCRNFNGRHNGAPSHQQRGSQNSILVSNKNDILVCLHLTGVIGRTVVTYAGKVAAM